MDEKFLFPSEEWVKEYCKRLSESPDYNKSGKGWKDPILFRIIDVESLSKKPQFDSFILHLKDGKCESCEIVKDPSKGAPFKLSATYANWKKIIDGKINPTQAMLTGQMKVEGNMALLLRYASAAIAMVKVAQSIPTEYLE
ncbi:MAG: SCP2 sterol-binding domain-containing protein [Thermoplasmata archaeon]|jgi:putative sterol carrier protein